jgi:hypothetical protein
MANKVPDPSCRPLQCPLTSAGFQAGAGTGLESSLWAEVDDQDIELCVQDLDASREATASGLGDCTRDCCLCALRWYARRIVNQTDN